MEFFKRQKLKQVNNSIYDDYGDKWYSTYEDPIALLRAATTAKIPWIIERIKNHNSQIILDVGCGGGFLSNALAKENFKVTGVDLSSNSIDVARAHDQTESVRYLVADAYHLPFPDQTFDAVTAMDFLEHVEDPQKIIDEISRVLKPNGIFIFHTYNRNIFSWLIIIKLIEWFVINTPKNMHLLKLFIKPSELTRYCQHSSMHVLEMIGTRPIFSSIPIKNYISGVIPKGIKFKYINSLFLAYMGISKKKGII